MRFLAWRFLSTYHSPEHCSGRCDPLVYGNHPLDHRLRSRRTASAQEMALGYTKTSWFLLPTLRVLLRGSPHERWANTAVSGPDRSKNRLGIVAFVSDRKPKHQCRRAPAIAVKVSGFCLILFSNGVKSGYSDPEWLCDAFGRLRSLRARWYLIGSAGCRVAWLQPQSADRIDRMRQNRRHHHALPRAVLRSGARLGLLISCGADPTRL